MSTIANLVIAVRADTGGAEKDIKGLGSKVSSGLGRALVPATLALGAMGVVGKAAFANLQDGARNAKQTESVIASTGGAANVTARHVDDLAMSLRRKAGVDDDVIHSGENMLLTFTNVRNEAGKGNDVFDQATKTMLDMSHALGQSSTASAMQLGKALNDPIKGMTALQRVGVSFTDGQKKQVKAMVDAGNTMGAQKLILHELNKEFGGSATNIDPTTKAIANMKLDVVDLASSLVAGLLPAMQVFVGIVGKATAFMTEHQTATKIVVGTLATLATVVLAVNVAMKLFAADGIIVTTATRLWTAAQWLLNAALNANPIGLVVIALVALGAAIAIAWTKSETFRRIVTGAWEAVRNTTLSVFNGIKDFLAKWWPLLLGIATGGVGLIVALVITKWGAITSATSSAWNAAAGVVTGVVNRIRWVVETVFGALGAVVSGAVGAVKAAIGALRAAFQPVLDMLHSIESAAHSAMSAVEAVVNAASKVKDVGGGILGKVGGLIPGHANGVINSPGGLAVVGERGPELVNLPRGADVFSNGQSRRMLGGGASVVVENMNVRSDEDVRLWAREVAVRLA